MNAPAIRPHPPRSSAQRRVRVGSNTDALARFPPAFGLLVGGTLGNLFDRLQVGAVSDFLAVPSLPSFNLADLAIIAAATLLSLAFWPRERTPKPAGRCSPFIDSRDGG